MSKLFRGYTQLSKAWYGESSLRGEKFYEKLQIGVYAEDGGCKFEFSITFGWPVKHAASVRLFDDSFSAFVELSDFFNALSELKDSSPPEDYVSILEHLGFKNITRTEFE